MRPTLVDSARAWWGHKYNRALQETGARIGRRLGKPADVWLKVTHRCSTRCVMCNIWQMSNTPSDELSTEQWKAILDDLRAWLGPYKVTITGGDPLVRRDMPVLFELCAKIGLLPEVITRGVGIKDEQAARRLVASGLVRYHVSIEALRPEVHDQLIPPAGTLERATRGLRWINEARRHQGSPLQIVIKSIIMGVNHQDILPLVNWVVENGFDQIKFQPIEQTLWEEEDANWHTRSGLWPQTGEALAGVIGVVEELIRRKRAGAPISNPEHELANMIRYFRDPEGMFRVVKDHVLGAVDAAHRMDGFEIWHNGEVRTTRQRPAIGMAREQALREIWRSRPQ